MPDEPSKPNSERDASGRFLPGSKGGTGRPRIPDDVREMWKAATPKATRRLIEMLDAERPIVVGGEVESVPDWDARHKAITTLYARQWGKEPQPITDEEGNSVGIMGLVLLPATRTDDGDAG